jgi:hypothetical protein
MTTSVKVAHFDVTNSPPIIVTSVFERNSDGQLLHIMDDKVRAIVPPESWEDYLKTWPEARPVVEALRTPRQELQEAVNAMLEASLSNMPDGTEIIVPTGSQDEPTE